MYVYIHLYIYIYMSTCLYIHAYTYKYIYMYVCMHIEMQTSDAGIVYAHCFGCARRSELASAKSRTCVPKRCDASLPRLWRSRAGSNNRPIKDYYWVAAKELNSNYHMCYVQ